MMLNHFAVVADDDADSNDLYRDGHNHDGHEVYQNGHSNENVEN